jgi:hypothetical protein
MITKLPYDYVSLQVDKLYERNFDENNIEGINNHCEFIADFIKACGWDEESFIRAMMGFEPLDKSSN